MASHKRILLKLSGEMLQGVDGFGIDPLSLKQVVSEIQKAVQAGLQLGIVIGGGNIFRGRALIKSGMKQARGDELGMLATVMNGLALQDACERAGIPSRVVSAVSMPGIVETYHEHTVLSYLNEGIVVIFVGGTGHPFFTTDTAASLRAIQMGATLLLKATKVSGVFDRDPLQHADAVCYSRLTHDEVIAQQLGVMDLTALCLCREYQLPIQVFCFSTPGFLLTAMRGETLGTLIGEDHD